MAKKKKITTKVDTSRKKVKEFDIDTNIKVSIKTGKILYGRKQVLREMRQNPFKMLIVANNIPKDLELELNHYNKLSKEKMYIHRYKGSSWDLGLACAKPYMISVIGIIDPGDSDLYSLKSQSN